MLSLLYVDDEPGLLEIGQLFLESSGDFSVVTVLSAKEALAKLAERSFDAIVSDYQMPEMDGIEFLKTVRRSFGDIPFILFTGRGREEIVIMAINHGADFYLQKGGDPKAQFAELAHKIRQAVSRKRAEHALSESEKRLTDLINFLPDATFAIDNNSRVIAWNRAIEEMTGIPATDMLGKGDYEYAIPFYGTRRPILIDLLGEPDEKLARYYSSILRDGNTLSAETDLPHPKGNQITVLAKASPLYNREGEIAGAIESVRDITERKKGEEELRAANEQLAASGEELRAQYDELAEGEMRIRESETRLSYMLGFYEYAQKSEKELSDYAVEGAGIVTGSPLGYLAFLSDDESELTMYAWSKAAMAECAMREKPIVYRTEKTGLWGEPVRQRRTVITNHYDAPDTKKKGYPEGHPRITRHMGVPVFDEERIVLVAGVANKPSDYTEHDAHELALLMRGLWSILKRKRAEAAAQNSLAFLNAFIDQNPNPVWISDDRGYLIRMNAACSRMLHAGIDELAGKYTILEDNIVETQGFMPLVKSVFEEGKVARFILNYDTAQLEPFNLKDTVNVVLYVTMFPIRDISGRITNAVIVHNDITEQRRAENELRAAYEQVTAAEEELRSQFDELSAAQEELRQRREQLEEIAATVPGVVYQFYARPTGEMGIYYASRRAIELLGIDNNEIEKFLAKFIEGVHPDDRQRCIDSIHDVVKAGIPWDFTGRFIRPTGEVIWVRGISSPVRHGTELVFSGVMLDITEQKNAELALIEERALKQALLDSIPGLVYIYTEEGHLIWWNKNHETITGYTAEELRGMHVLDWFRHDENAVTVIRAGIEHAMREGTGSAVAEILTKDGRKIPFYFTAVALDIGGKKHFTGIGIDITASRQAEAALTESEARYRLIAENSPDMIYYIDPEGYVKYVNSRAAEVMQTAPENMTGKHLTAIFTPELARRHMEAIRHVIDSRASLRTEVLETFPTGKTWIDVRLSPLVDENEKVIGVLGLSHDISDRKSTEQALRESEEKYRLLVENSNDIIYSITSEGILTFVSPGWTTQLGHDPAYVAGKPFQNFIHPADIPACEEFLAKAVSTGKRQTGIEYRTFHADGSVRIHTSTISPIFDESGQAVSYVGNARDITEMRQVQNAIRESNRKLNLLSSITRHDVANQLTVVQGYVQLAALRKPDGVTADFLAKIAAAIDTIQHQLDFARTYQDLGMQAPAWFRVSDVIQAACPAGITLDCTCAATEIFADPMIGKVFFNLFDNAARYGEHVTTVTARCEMAGDDLVISFADDGVGIPLDEKQKIFEKGYGRHTGFGLFLVREILAITGISIVETGVHGRGARFEIAVPKGAFRSGPE